jgi:hypothetical protein
MQMATMKIGMPFGTAKAKVLKVQKEAMVEPVKEKSLISKLAPRSVCLD